MPGYDELSDLIGTHRELSIFRRFSVLNAKNLLYMQAGIINLDAELKSIVREDKGSGDKDRESYPCWMQTLRESEGKLGKDFQWMKILEVRKALKEYNEALLQLAQISKLEKTSRADLMFLQEWLARPDGGNLFLRSYEYETWNDKNPEEYVTLFSGLEERDPFTLWVRDVLVRWWQNNFGPQTEAPTAGDNSLWKYEDSKIFAATSAISTILSTLLPTSSIFALYFLQTSTAKLGAIVAFTVLFSLVLSMVTKARRVDIFVVATA